MNFNCGKPHCSKQRFVNAAYVLVVLVLVVFQTASTALYAQTATNTLVQQYRLGTQQLDSAIASGQVLTIKNALETLHGVYDKNPNFFEVIRDMAHGYYMVGDFDSALLYTHKALKLKDEENLQTLRLQLLMRTMPISDIRMNKGGAEEVKKLLDTLLARASYNPNVLYVASVYFSIVGDERNYKKVLIRFRSLYKSHQKYQKLLHVYTLVDAIQSEKKSSESEESFVALQSYDANPWIAWLLLHYIGMFHVDATGMFVDDNFLEMFTAYTERLLQSDIVHLQATGYIMRFNFFFSQSEMEQAQEVTEQYSKHFPRRGDAWLRHGIALHRLKDYGNALQAFARADAASANNRFINFMYDTTLKDARVVFYEGMEEIAQKRVAVLVAFATSALDRGDAQTARHYARRALYIEPLAAEARLILADIFRQQGALSAAEEELSLLENTEGILPRVTREIESIRAEIRAGLDDYPVVQKLLDAGSFSHISYDPVAWNIQTNVAAYNEGSPTAPVLRVFDTASLQYAEGFFTRLLEYSLNKFPSIRVADSGETSNAAHTQNVAVTFSYSEINGIFSVHAHLSNANSHEHITTFIESRSGNNRVEEAMQAMAVRVQNALPVLMPVLATSGNTVVLGRGNYDTMERFLVPVFDNGLVELSVESPYFISSSSLIGFAKIEKTVANTNVASLQPSIGEPLSLEQTATASEDMQVFQKEVLPILTKLYGQKTFSVFDMRSRVNAGDIVIIPPRQWVDDEGTENESYESIQTTLLTTMRMSLR